MADILFCTHCGYKGKPKTITKGSFFIEILLWVCFIVPGLCYSIWRVTSRHKACPSCGAPHMIPLDSPKAQQILDLKPRVPEQ